MIQNWDKWVICNYFASEGPGKLEKWNGKNLLELSKRRCWVLWLGSNNPWHQERLKSTWKALQRQHGLTTGQQCALAGQKIKGTPGCMRQSAASRSREVFLECQVLLWDPQKMKYMELLEGVQQRWLRALTYEKRPRNVGLFIPERWRLSKMLSMCTNTQLWEMRKSQALLSGDKWLDKKQWAKTEIMEIQFKHKKTAFTVR